MEQQIARGVNFDELFNFDFSARAKLLQFKIDKTAEKESKKEREKKFRQVCRALKFFNLVSSAR
jgi:tRNA A37 methylthiotransferase MiaB